MITVKVDTIQKKWLSSQEAQEYLGVSGDFFKHLRDEGKLQFYKVGKKQIFYKVSDIDKLIEKGKQL